MVPIAPASVDPAIPEVVSSIVMKLLVKDAAGRYQTAAGLRADLQACLGQLNRGEVRAFPLGRADHTGELHDSSWEEIWGSKLGRRREWMKEATEQVETNELAEKKERTTEIMWSVVGRKPLYGVLRQASAKQQRVVLIPGVD